VAAEFPFDEEKNADWSGERWSYFFRASFVNATVAGQLGTAVPTGFALIERFARAQRAEGEIRAGKYTVSPK
jgi:uncharacterized membrane protein